MAIKLMIRRKDIWGSQLLDAAGSSSDAAVRVLQEARLRDPHHRRKLVIHSFRNTQEDVSLAGQKLVILDAFPYCPWLLQPNCPRSAS